MELLVPSPGVPLEPCRNAWPRQMIIKYRTRLIDLLAPLMTGFDQSFFVASIWICHE